MTKPGHNGIDKEDLEGFVSQIERLEEEKKVLSDNMRELYSDAGDSGFDVKTLRKIIALRKKDYAKRVEEEAMLDLYMEALGMFSDTPLGKAAIERAHA